MRSPKAPKTPDPNVVSQAQTQSNQQTAAYDAALQRQNTYTPWGSQTFTQNGTDPATGAPRWDQTIKMDPRLQGAYDQQMDQNARLTETAGGMLDQIRSNYSQPINTSGVPQLRDAPNMQSYQTQLDTNGLPQLNAGYQSQYNTGSLPQLQSSLNVNGPELQGQIDMSNLPELYGANDLNGARDQTQEALYRRSTSMLDPQWQQRDTAFRQRMNDRGVTEGSEAWRTALDDENRARSMDYGYARDSSILAGGDEMSRLAGIASNNRGQTFGERVTGGQFTNNARAQAMAEAMNRGQFNNNARAQGFAEQGAMTDDAARAAQFGNDARAQGFGERAASMNATNTAVGAGNADAINAAQFGNQARAQGMDEAYRARALPFAEYSALRGAAPLEMPQFQAPGQTNMAPTDVAGNMWNAYQGEANNYNAQMAGQNGMMGGLMNLGGQLGSAWISSDARIKSNIRPAGRLPDGTNLYDYYKGGRPERGVLAQEVEQRDPQAVKTGPGGVKHVNYGRVLARAMAA